RDDAVAAAEEEISFAESLCTQASDTLIAVHRTFEDGAVRESFRTLRPRGGAKPARAFSFLEVDGEDEQPAEDVNLVAKVDRERKGRPSGSPAAHICSIAARMAACMSPTSF